MDALLDSKKLEAAKKVEGSEEDFVNVTKKANRKDSDSYKILESIGDLARTLAPLLQDPKRIFTDGPAIRVLVTNDVIKTNAT